jgi:hypothetical protein
VKKNIITEKVLKRPNILMSYSMSKIPTTAASKQEHQKNEEAHPNLTKGNRAYSAAVCRNITRYK